MDYARLQYELRHTPSLRLLQKETAPLIVSFLPDQFKRANRIVIATAELTDQLRKMLDERNIAEGRRALPAIDRCGRRCDRWRRSFAAV